MRMLKKAISELNIHLENFAIHQKSTKTTKIFSTLTFTVYSIDGANKFATLKTAEGYLTIHWI